MDHWLNPSKPHPHHLPPGKLRVASWRLVALAIPLLLLAPWVAGCNDNTESGYWMLRAGSEAMVEMATNPGKTLKELKREGLKADVFEVLAVFGLPSLALAGAVALGFFSFRQRWAYLAGPVAWMTSFALALPPTVYSGFEGAWSEMRWGFLVTLGCFVSVALLETGVAWTQRRRGTNDADPGPVSSLDT